MEYKDIVKLNKKELLQLCVKQIEEVEAVILSIREERKQVSSLLASMGDGDRIIQKIEDLYDTIKSCDKFIVEITRKGYYGSQFEDIPKAVSELYGKLPLFEKLENAILKLGKYLKNFDGDMEVLEREISSLRTNMKNVVGLAQYKPYLNYLNPSSYSSGNDYLRDVKRPLTIVQLNLSSLISFNNQFVAFGKFLKEDITIIKHSIVILTEIGRHIETNQENWKRRDVSYGPFSADYSRVLPKIYKSLKELIVMLKELDNDKLFEKIMGTPLLVPENIETWGGLEKVFEQLKLEEKK